MSSRKVREKLRQQRIAFDRKVEEVRKAKELEIKVDEAEEKAEKKEPPKEEKKPAKRGRPSKKKETK